MGCTGGCPECDAYERQIKDICDEAIQFIQQRPSVTPLGKHPLIIFDIDGTALDDRLTSRHPDNTLKKHPSVFLFYTTANSLGYDIVFLTGRREDSGKTRLNLSSEGYLPQHNIIFCPTHVYHSVHDIGVWKDEARSELEQTYHLVACIGDQPMDVAGRHVGEKQFRLPEPPIHQQCTIQ
jgi:hypothetical protein